MTRRPSVTAALLLIATMDAVPRLVGFERSIRFARWLARGRARETQFTVDQLLRTIAIAAALYPRRAQCLEQSLALYVLLQRHGIDARLRIGVQPMPFYAHAWVELDDRPLNESEARIEQLVPFQIGA